MICDLCVCRLLVQDMSNESLLSTEAVLEGRPAERYRRHGRCPAQETPCTFGLALRVISMLPVTSSSQESGLNKCSTAAI